jgi:8-oxo-dGTP pyrophosphatase MutT (NUDIX family)
MKTTAAGVAIIHRGLVLLALRGTESNNSNEWSFIGGRCESNELPIHAAIREVSEESGVQLTESCLKPLGAYKRSRGCYRVYYTIQVIRPVPRLLSENSDYGWFSRRSVQHLHAVGKLHHGVVALLPKLTTLLVTHGRVNALS